MFSGVGRAWSVQTSAGIMKTLAATLFALTAMACSGGSDHKSDSDAGGKNDSGKIAPCQAELQAAIIAAAQEINETAELIETRPLYGDKTSLGRAITARISDDTEPSDWIAVALFEDDGAVPEGEPVGGDEGFGCKIVYHEMVNTGSVADDLATAAAEASLPEPSCVDKVKLIVHERALDLNETAEIVGVVPLYGSSTSGTVVHDTMQSAMLVRASDEVDPTDYLVVVDNSDCSLQSIEMLGEGVLPDINGLP
jgi:hypothetical protein